MEPDPHLNPATRQDLRILTVTMLTAVWVVGLAGCGRPQSGNQSAAAPQEATDFATLFGNHCSGCHGADGKMGPAPPLNDPLFLAVVPESEMLDVVRGGRPNTLMTAFGGKGWNALNENQTAALVSEIRSRWGTGEQAPNDAPPYLSPDSHGDAAAGEKLFGAICASCHGTDGRGGTKAGALHSEDFLSLISDQALRRIVITGRPDLGMPDYRDLGRRRGSKQPLTSTEVADIVALLASWRGADVSPNETPTNHGGSSK